jgi:hypothetical protein
MSDPNRILSIEDCQRISSFPMVVFSDNLTSWISTAIKQHQQWSYNHAMWLIAPGVVASQDALFHRAPLSEYLQGAHRLKFWTNPRWTDGDRRRIRQAIAADLQRPWYRRLYDPVAIVGQALHADWIQLPWVNICSDRASYLAEVDPEYNLSHPDPADVNRWLDSRGIYDVYGRFIPD